MLLIEFYDLASAKEWRIANGVLKGSVELAKAAKDYLNIAAEHACLGFISGIAGTAAPCGFAMTIAQKIVLGIWIALKLVSRCCCFLNYCLISLRFSHVLF
jgi:hypothetical protein